MRKRQKQHMASQGRRHTRHTQTTKSKLPRILNKPFTMFKGKPKGKDKQQNNLG